MNHTNSLIWSARNQAGVALAVRPRLRRKGTGTGTALKEQSTGAELQTQTFALSLFAMAVALCFNPFQSAQAQTKAPLPSTALPTGGQVSAGSAVISQAGNVLTINQTSQRAALDWQTFNIGSAASVNFKQPSASAVALNRILDNSASEIYGKLNANGQVFFSNPAGVLFGAGAQVNVGSLLATTLQFNNNDDFVAGGTDALNLTGAAGNGGIVRNEGLIAANSSVALIGNTVQNAGQITATTATLAAGNTIALDLTGEGLIRVRVTDASLQAAIENSGGITATQAVTMTAGQARHAVHSVVSNAGVIRATGLVSRGGEIYLEGAQVKNTGLLEAKTPIIDPTNAGTLPTPGSIWLMGNMDTGSVEVGGTLDASAPVSGNGGFIETSAASVTVHNDAKVTTLAANGSTGSWLIDPTDFNIAASGGNISGSTLSSSLASNDVTIQSTSGTSGTAGNVNVNDTVSWSANKLTLNAQADININSTLNGSGTASLALEYGQAAVAAGNTSNYNVNAPVNLPSGNNLSTKLGSDGAVVRYTVINSLGASGSTTGTDLQGMQGDLTGKYALGSNIDASATSGWNAGAGFLPIGTGASFAGAFHGLGHTISGLYINLPNDMNVGLFSYALTPAVIRNVGLTGVNVTGWRNVGSLVGISDGTISDSYASGAVTGDRKVGGLVGSSNGTITKSHATSTVSATGGSAGGLAGMNNGTVTQSYATGNVSGTGGTIGGLVGENYAAIDTSYSTGSVAGDTIVGGFVGWSTSTGNISTSYSTSSVSGTGDSVGGFVGINGASISQSYAIGSATGATWVGGFSGQNINGYITNSYATGNATAIATGGYPKGVAGGFTGYNYGRNRITNSYSSGRAVGTQAYVGGFVGFAEQSISDSSFWDQTSSGNATSGNRVNGVGTGRTNTVMKTLSTFSLAGWSVSNSSSDSSTWYISEGATYPLIRSILSSQYTAPNTGQTTTAQTSVPEAISSVLNTVSSVLVSTTSNPPPSTAATDAIAPSTDERAAQKSDTTTAAITEVSSDGTNPPGTSSPTQTTTANVERKTESVAVAVQTLNVAGSAVQKPVDQIVAPVNTKGIQLMCRKTG